MQIILSLPLHIHCKLLHELLIKSKGMTSISQQRFAPCGNPDLIQGPIWSKRPNKEPDVYRALSASSLSRGVVLRGSVVLPKPEFCWILVQVSLQCRKVCFYWGLIKPRKYMKNSYPRAWTFGFIIKDCSLKKEGGDLLFRDSKAKFLLSFVNYQILKHAAKLQRIFSRDSIVYSNAWKQLILLDVPSFFPFFILELFMHGSPVSHADCFSGGCA